MAQKTGSSQAGMIKKGGTEGARGGRGGRGGGGKGGSGSGGAKKNEVAPLPPSSRLPVGLILARASPPHS